MRSSLLTKADPSSRPTGLARFVRIAPREWLDAGSAVAELAIARVQLARRIPLERFNTNNATVLNPGAIEKVKRVQLAIDRASRRVPWRSTCLVRALAVQNWLGRSGIKSDLRIGVKMEAEDELDAHAWLTHGDIVLIGGPVEGYRMLSSVATSSPSGRP